MSKLVIIWPVGGKNQHRSRAILSTQDARYWTRNNVKVKTTRSSHEVENDSWVEQYGVNPLARKCCPKG